MSSTSDTRICPSAICTMNHPVSKYGSLAFRRAIFLFCSIIPVTDSHSPMETMAGTGTGSILREAVLPYI